MHLIPSFLLETALSWYLWPFLWFSYSPVTAYLESSAAFLPPLSFQMTCTNAQASFSVHAPPRAHPPQGTFCHLCTEPPKSTLSSTFPFSNLQFHFSFYSCPQDIPTVMSVASHPAGSGNPLPSQYARSGQPVLSAWTLLSHPDLPHASLTALLLPIPRHQVLLQNVPHISFFIFVPFSTWLSAPVPHGLWAEDPTPISSPHPSVPLAPLRPPQTSWHLPPCLSLFSASLCLMSYDI